LRKADRTEAVDPLTGDPVPLFNPRIHLWIEHFRMEGHRVVGLTPIGRAAVHLLGLNDPRRVLIRRGEELLGLFPP
jgi:hypothetical protein